jgi:MoaA/NifB/PqqE/SkfB family radical SAM enzyme
MKSSIVRWYNLVFQKKIVSKKDIDLLFSVLKKELPKICSLILERSCCFQCKHCIFQPEKPKPPAIDLNKIIKNIAEQLPKKAAIVHEGRVFKNWHIPILIEIRKIRPDLKIGLIDNGNFLFDWIDISIDGPKKIHNFQRNSEKSFDIAVESLKKARNFLVKNGRLTCLFTATKINFKYIYETADFLFSNNLIDEFHITPMSVVRKELEKLSLNAKDYRIFLLQLKKVFKKYQNKTENRLFFRIYQHSDILKIATATGFSKFLGGFTDFKKIRIGQGNISFVLNGIRMTYVPLSICPSETFVIDIDGIYRLPYSIKYTLDELRKGITKNGEDINIYSIAKLNDKSKFDESYEIVVDKWEKTFGQVTLKEEIETFRKIRDKL